MAFKLSLPKIAEQPDPNVETRAVYVEEWVDGLAYANPPRLVEQMLESLRALNQQPLKPAHRLQLLELYCKPFQFAFEFRRGERRAITSVAIRRQRELTRQLRKCAEALALGYKQALSEYSGRRSKSASTRESRLLLQRSILFTGLALMLCYEAYRPTVKGLWRELVALYKFAVKSGVESSGVSASADGELFARSCDHLFRRFCLTGLTDPYHLAAGELWHVFDSFAALADEVNIVRVHEVERPASVFVIDPSDDAPPEAFSRRSDTASERCRLLDAKAVHAALQRMHRGKRSDDALDDHLLAAMIRALGLPPRRHTPRETSEDRVMVVAGLAAVHHFVSGGSGDARATSAEPTDDGEIEVGSASGVDIEFTASYGAENWVLFNEGPGGVGIYKDDPPKLPLGVGELAGLRFPRRGDAEDDWTLAVVRWMRIEPEGRHTIGLQVLAERVTPLSAHAENVTDTVTRIARPSLALPAISSDPSASVVVSRGVFRSGDQVRVVESGSTCRVQLGARTEGTGAFDRFSYELVD